MADADFSFASEAAKGAPWGHLQVVRLRGREGISEPYRYELTLIAKAPAPEVDPRDLIGKRATLRIATQSTPALKVVHGIMTEAEELFEAPDGMIYRVILSPPWARAKHRKKCRIFLDKTLRQIIDAVLSGDPLMRLSAGAEVSDDSGSPAYAPAEEIYTWRVRDASRLDDRRVRSYVVQYNESDFDFVSRLLEEEGISYHFENGEEQCLLVLTDHDGGRWRLAPDVLGAGVDGREVSRVQLGARLRPRGVVLDDYNWKKPKLEMAARALGEGDLQEYHYPGGYPDAPDQGKPLAAARVDRYQIEAAYAVAEGSVRVLSAGSIFKLEHKDAEHEGEYVVTGLEARGEQQGVVSLPSGDQDVPWAARFTLARRGAGKSASESRFRPALTTPKARIQGTHTAVVTADPGASGAEINVGGPDGISIGCVRVRFRWDTEEARLAKEPSSAWVRVSQVFAGSGEGAVWHPRVGDEVLVDFEEGDPDRPIVIGRVYNGASLPAHGGAPASSMKSLSTPGGGTYNEIMYDDSGGGELLHYFAGKDQTTDVGNNRREDVASNATMIVGSNNSETIGANRAEIVGANDSLTVGGNQTIIIGANSTTLVGGNCTKVVGANEVNIAGGFQTITIGGNLTETIGGAVLEVYGAARFTTVGGAVTETFGAAMTVGVAGNVDEKCATHSLSVSAARLMAIGGNYTTTVKGSSTTTVGAVSIEASGGPQKVSVGGNIIRLGPVHFTFTPLEKDIRAIHLDAQGSSKTKTILLLEALGAAGEVFGLKHLKYKNKNTPTGFEAHAYGVETQMIAIGMLVQGVDVQGGGPQADA
jgi:type VI secretion system secreted protein VgrG